MAPATSPGAREKLANGALIRLVPLAQRRWMPRLPSFTEQSSACLAAPSSTRPCFTGLSKRSFGVTVVEVAARSKSNSSAVATVGSISWSPSPSSLRLSSIGGGPAGSRSGNFGSSRACVSSCLASRLGDRSTVPAALTLLLVLGLTRGWLGAARDTRAGWRGSRPGGHARRGRRIRDASRCRCPQSS